MTTARTSTTARRILAAGLACATGLAWASPAAALHRQCSGYGMGYVSSLGNGHPDPNFEDRTGPSSYVGGTAEYTIETDIIALEGSIALIGSGTSVLSEIASGFDDGDPPTPGDIMHFAAAAAHGAILALEAALIAVNENYHVVTAQNAGVSDCANTLTRDTIDTLWVAQVLRDLASSDPPMAMLMLPNSYDPELDDDGIPTYFDGFILGDPHVADEDVGNHIPQELSVKYIVRHFYNRMVATGQPVSASALTYLNQADTQLANGQYKAAYKSYRLAYRYTVQ